MASTHQTVDGPGAGPGAPPAPDRSLRRAGTTAGVALLLMAALAGLANLAVLEVLVTPGDAATTAADIGDSEGLFRTGVLLLFGVVVLDVVVAAALYRVLSPVDDRLSLLAAALRLVYAGVLAAAAAHLVGALRLLADPDHLAALDEPQRHTRALLDIDAYGDLWDAGLVLFGLHLLVVGYLAYRSGYIPRLLGVLLGIAGAGYVLDSGMAVLAGDPAVEVSTVTFVGEFLLALWLVVRGPRLTVATADRGVR